MDSDKFAVRDKATEALKKAGHVALPFLEEALKGKHSLEKAKRLEGLGAPLRDTQVAHELNMCRIIDVLERVTTPAARELLGDIANNGYGPAFAAEAKKTLKR